MDDQERSIREQLLQLIDQTGDIQRALIVFMSLVKHFIELLQQLFEISDFRVIRDDVIEVIKSNLFDELPGIAGVV